MITTNTQANSITALLGSVSPAATALMGSGGPALSPRFDLMLLEMTKQVSDSAAAITEQNQSFVPEKVSKALESALINLAKQTPQTMQKLGVNSQFKATLVSQVAQELKLDIPQQKQLEQLVELATQRLTASLDVSVNQEPENVTFQAIPVLNSGPQGGTTETPSGLDKTNTQAQQFLAPKDPSKDITLNSALAAAVMTAPASIVNLANQVSTPELVSTRTQDIKSESSLSFDPFLKGQSVQQPKQLVLTTQEQVPTETVPQQLTQSAVVPKQSAQQTQQPMQSAVAPKQPVQQTQQQMALVPETAEVAALKVPNTLTLPESNTSIKNQVSTTMKSASQPETPVSNGAKAQTPEKSVFQPELPTVQAEKSDMPFQVELLTKQSQPEIVQGSEVVLGQPLKQAVVSSQQSSPVAESQNVLPQGKQQTQSTPLTAAVPDATLAATVPAEPVVVPVQTQSKVVVVPQVLTVPVNVPAQQIVAQDRVDATPQSVASTTPQPEQVILQASNTVPQPLRSENGQAMPVVSENADDAGSRPASISPLKRWLSETLQADSKPAANATTALNTPTLNSDTLKDFAASVTREFGLRQTVFTQALSALENATQGNNQLKIRLKPESLGSLDVTLKVEDGKLTARIVASSPEVRDVFVGNLQQFKQSLEAQGLQVNQLSVAVRAETGAQSQAGQQQPQQFQFLQRSILQDTQGSAVAMNALFASIGADPSLQRFSALA